MALKNKQSRLRKMFVVGMVVAFCFASLILGGAIVRSWKHRVWNGGEPYRILIIHGKQGTQPTGIELLSVWPEPQKAVSLSIPSELVISAVGGYGNYQLTSLVEMGRVEKVGDKLLRDSLGFTFGVPIHQVLWQQKSSLDIGQARNEILRQGFAGRMSMPEAIDLFKLLSKIKHSSIERLVLSETNVVRSSVGTDGATNLVPERALLSRYMIDRLSTMWKDAALMQVSVINASGKPQQASLWSLYALVGGYDVVSVTDSQTIQDKTRIIYSKKELSETLAGKALATMFVGASVEVGDTTSYRSQVAIVLGLNSWRYLTDRELYLSTVR